MVLSSGPSALMRLPCACRASTQARPAPRRRASGARGGGDAERHLPVDEVEQGGVGLLGMRTHEAPEALDGATRARPGYARNTRERRGRSRPSSARLVATMTASSPARARSSSSLRTARLTSPVSTAAETPSASMAAASAWQWSMRPESTRQTWPVGFASDVLDDERVARWIACDGGEHRRVVLRAGVEVLEVRLDAVDVGHREDARGDQLVVRDGDERRAQEQVEQRGQPVFRSGVAVRPSGTARGSGRPTESGTCSRRRGGPRRG